MTHVKTLLKALIEAASLAMLIVYKTKNGVLSYVIQQHTRQGMLVPVAIKTQGPFVWFSVVVP